MSLTIRGLWKHFNRMHWRDSIQILEEHPTPFLHCEMCSCQVPPRQLKNWHYTLDQCRLGRDLQCRRETLQQCFESSQVYIKVKTYPLELADSLTYLGRTIAYNNR